MSKTSDCSSDICLLTNSKKRRLRRYRLHTALKTIQLVNNTLDKPQNINIHSLEKEYVPQTVANVSTKDLIEMSSKDSTKSREEVLAAREAKKLAKLKAKNKGTSNEIKDELLTKEKQKTNIVINDNKINEKKENLDTDQPKADIQEKIISNEVKPAVDMVLSKSKDEVDRVLSLDTKNENLQDRNKIISERAIKRPAKQAKKKDTGDNASVQSSITNTDVSAQLTVNKSQDVHINDMTVKDVVDTLKDIVNVAKEVKEVTAKIQSIDLAAKKPDETNRSKADLRAERRAKQEAQRLAKQTTLEQKIAKQKPEIKNETVPPPPKDKPVKHCKTLEKPKVKSTSAQRINWFQHLYTGHSEESLRKIPVNSNLHPAITKLGVQLASRVVKGSNARCIALLDALKKMVRDYTLPVKTEFARGLEAHLALSLDFLWSMRQPSASQTNAVKFFRNQLTHLPNDVDEFDAKKTLQEEIDRYISEQIDKAWEAISEEVRKKISNGDQILTYGCSSLIERILVDAYEDSISFRTVVVGNRILQAEATEMLRRLTAKGLPCTYIDISSLSFLMPTVNKVVVSASALLVNGSVLGAAGTAQVALVARAANVPVLVACETHKFSERVQTDAFVYNEIGNPDDLIDKSDDNSPLKDWRSRSNLTPLNLTYDVTPPSLVTAVVTEIAILPCTSAPVVLRFKLSEYGI